MGAKVILPDRLVADPAALKRALENGHRAVVEAAAVDFHVTTRTWKHQPAFAVSWTASGGEVTTADKIYRWIDQGTKAHTILPKNKKVLAFPSGSQAKTTPGEIRSQPRTHGGGTIFARVVRHPGIQPRNFEEAIAKKWRAEYPKQMQRAIDSAVES